MNAAGVHLPGSALLFFLPLFTNDLEDAFSEVRMAPILCGMHPPTVLQGA